ncbi:MAG: TonB family protein [Pyrinomonadaceae bacterium]
MRHRITLLLSALCLLAFATSVAAAHTRFGSATVVPASRRALASFDNETDRDRDGLQGPVRRVRTETSKLVSQTGKLSEGARVVLETATYDMKGAKIDNAYFLGTGGALTGKEVYKYDDRGNIVEMTLFNADSSVLSKERYEYEFDALGNWTKMTTSVAVIENGQMSFEPTEVTYRIIAYYLEDATSGKLQTAALSNNTNAASIAPASLSGNKAPATSVAVKPQTPAAAQTNLSGGAATTTTAANPTAPAVKRVNHAPALPASSNAPVSVSTLTLGLPNAAAMPSANNNGSAPVVKSSEDVPPPPPPTAKPIVKAPVRPVSGGVLNGKALQMPLPLYPETARRARIMGMVSVEVVIDATGKVIGARAVSGPEMLRDAAERAARQARFSPALLDGQPVKVSGIINYNFSN